MPPEDITDEPSDRLRHRGVRADLPERRNGDHGIGALARRQGDAQATAAKTLRWERALAWTVCACAAGVAALLLEIGVLFWLAGIRDYPASARVGEEAWDIVAILIGTCIVAAGGSLLAFAIARTARGLRELSRKLDRIEEPDA